MSPFELDLFIGRFHPLFVHLPIGFIILTILLEIAGQIKKDTASLLNIILWCYPAAVIASILSVGSGWLLSGDRVYPPDVLFTHKWLGIATLLMVSLAWGVKLKYNDLSRIKALMVFLTLMVVVSFTGHYGGVLTHGNGYLNEFAPVFFKNISGDFEKGYEKILEGHPDSVEIYSDIIHPFIQKKCITCHNSKEAYGNFNASNYRDLFLPSDDGTPIVPDNILLSELFTRISSPPGVKQFMPPRGEHLSYSETLILKYWIENGADSMARFEFNSMNQELVDLLIRDYNLDYRPKPYYEKSIPDSVSATIMSTLLEEGYIVQYLGIENQFLDIRYEKDSISDQKLLLLNDVQNNVTFLNLSKTGITDNQLSKLSTLSHLTRLDLHDNSITDEGISHLLHLVHLESLNLFNTKISDEGLSQLLSLPKLKNLYVWKSSVTDEQVKKLSFNYPEITINNGFAFDPSQIPVEKKDGR